MNVTTTVYCKVQVEGIHHWPGCPFEEVSYLKLPHRHVFHVVAHKEVNHDDRDIEFIMLQHKVKQYLIETYWNEQNKCCVFGAMSCEMIGRELMERFDLCMVDVSEDNENGAVIKKL